MDLPDSCKISRVPHYSGNQSKKVSKLSHKRLSRSMVCFPNTSASFSFCNFPAYAWSIPTTPSKNFEGLGYSHFARRYSGNHIVFFSTGYWDGSLPQVGFTLTMYSSKNDTSYSYRVSPFGNLRVLACLQLIVAFRSLPRPSSPVYA